MQNRSILRVLVVDDDAAIRDLVRSSLGTEGYRVEVAVNGTQAIERLIYYRPDAMVLDITMPELDGFGVLEALRVRRMSVPVLVMSARHAPDDVRKAISLGAKDYLAKPFNNGQLIARVARLIHQATIMPRTVDKNVAHLSDRER